MIEEEEEERRKSCLRGTGHTLSLFLCRGDDNTHSSWVIGAEATHCLPIQLALQQGGDVLLGVSDQKGDLVPPSLWKRGRLQLLQPGTFPFTLSLPSSMQAHAGAGVWGELDLTPGAKVTADLTATLHTYPPINVAVPLVTLPPSCACTRSGSPGTGVKVSVDNDFSSLSRVEGCIALALQHHTADWPGGSVQP